MSYNFIKWNAYRILNCVFFSRLRFTLNHAYEILSAKPSCSRGFGEHCMFSGVIDETQFPRQKFYMRGWRTSVGHVNAVWPRFEIPSKGNDGLHRNRSKIYGLSSFFLLNSPGKINNKRFVCLVNWIYNETNAVKMLYFALKSWIIAGFTGQKNKMADEMWNFWHRCINLIIYAVLHTASHFFAQFHADLLLNLHFITCDSATDSYILQIFVLKACDGNWYFLSIMDCEILFLAFSFLIFC